MDHKIHTFKVCSSVVFNMFSVVEPSPLSNCRTEGNRVQISSHSLSFNSPSLW